MASFTGVFIYVLLVFSFTAEGKIIKQKKANDPGEPLFLTPLIEAGQIDTAQELSRVQGISEFESYSGYLTVNPVFESNIFFWFFPAVSDPENVPLLLWLNGGPGTSSMMALFTENGPFYVDENQKLQPRPFAWTETHSVVYIDNPVGTGFSFTNDIQGYARNQTDVGVNLYEALIQFFTLFPQYQSNDFYVTGESYAGKYVPAISYKIHTENPTANLKINFKGMAIGNGLTDPESMLHYGDFLYQIGLIDGNALRHFREQEALMVQYIQDEKWLDATDAMHALILGGGNTYFAQVTGYVNYYNYLRTSYNYDNFSQFLQLDEIRQAIHVGNSTFHSGALVNQLLEEDIMKSVKPWVEDLLNAGYKVLFYNGQLDIIVAYPLTESLLNSLNWDLSDEYKLSERFQWQVDGELAGYVRQAGNLLDVLVRNAGHMVPTDQPKWGFDLINRFTSSQSLFNKVPYPHVAPQVHPI